MSKFRVVLSDRSFNVLDILDNEYLDLHWSYSRIGGCGEFGFRVPRKLFEEKSLSGDFNIKIYYRNPTTKTHVLWYQGLIENKIPAVEGNTENIEVSGHGYQSQLSRIYLDNITYTSQEASVIIADIIDTYVAPYTDITKGTVSVTDFTFDTINFNTTALSAIQTIADTVGTREWGVNKDRVFFFQERSSTVGRRFSFGHNILNYNENQDFTDIINKVIVQGAQAGGTYYKSTYNDTISQLKYGIRASVIQNSSVVTSAVAAQLADAVFAEKNDVQRKASCELAGLEARLEATTPIDLINILGKEIKYNERRYGEFLYSGNVDRIVNRINYNLSNSGTLRIYLDLGQQKPTLSDKISQLEYKIEQERSAAL